MAWLGISGTVLLVDNELAKLTEWRFDVEPPYETEEKGPAEVIREALRGARGYFRVGGTASDALLGAIRSGDLLTVACEAGIGTVQAEVDVDPALVGLRAVTDPLFAFTVAGDVRFSERAPQG
jgi:hypothetical protein